MTRSLTPSSTLSSFFSLRSCSKVTISKPLKMLTAFSINSSLVMISAGLSTKAIFESLSGGSSVLSEL